jgi:hypothetical protein
LTINPSTGAITYQANTGFFGTDSLIYTIADEANAVSNPARVTISVTNASAVLNDGSQLWQMPIGSTADIARIFAQLLSQRLSSLYEPLMLWWTEGSSPVEPSCLVSKGLPHPSSFVALLDGQWSQSGWRSARNASC